MQNHHSTGRSTVKPQHDHKLRAMPLLGLLRSHTGGGGEELKSAVIAQSPLAKRWSGWPIRPLIALRAEGCGGRHRSCHNLPQMVVKECKHTDKSQYTVV